MAQEYDNQGSQKQVDQSGTQETVLKYIEQRFMMSNLSVFEKELQ